MKKLLFIIFCIVGCAPVSKEEMAANWILRLPPESIIITTYDRQYTDWVVWKYKGQCFISSRHDRSFSTTKIDCVPESEGK
jgi:hypothetical protein